MQKQDVYQNQVYMSIKTFIEQRPSRGRRDSKREREKRLHTVNTERERDSLTRLKDKTGINNEYKNYT